MTVRVEFDLTRGGTVDHRAVDVRRNTPLRAALRLAGLPPEGSAVLAGETPVPLDLPLEESGRFTVIATFSGG